MPDNLHAILKRPRNGIERIGGRDEHDLGKIVRQIQIVIAECSDSARDPEPRESRGRIAAKVRPHLVDFIHQKHRIVRTRLFDRLNNPTRHRADIGAPMAANLGFVSHTAERHPDKLSAGCPRDRTAQRRLTDPRRSDETKYRSFDFADEALDGEIFENAFFDLLQVRNGPLRGLSRLR